MISLRPYQSKVLDELYAWFESHPQGHPIVEACVASGKSIMIAEFCRKALAEFEGTRILMLVHVKELVEQNLGELLTMWPDAPVGVCAASLNSRNTDAQIIFGTIQTVRSRVKEIGFCHLMIVDECHLINPKEVGTYRQVIRELTQINPDFRVIGFTGTPFRGNGVWLTHGDTPLFTHITGRIRIADMVAQGYLAKMVKVETSVKSDISGVEIDSKTGDYKIDQLSRALNDQDYINAAVPEAIELAQGRSKIMVFCADITHCQAVARCFEAHGESVAYITSKTSKSQREETIERFRQGEIRWLVNVAILTTGFNVPQIDCIVLMRNTISPVLYVQIAGRGLRIADGKADCLWLDFTGTTASLGPIDLINGKPKREKITGTSPFKTCEECGHQCATGCAQCPECGFEFPKNARSLSLSDAEILAAQRKPKWVKVSKVYYSVHQSRSGKEPTIKVSYANNLMTIANEFLSFARDAHPYAFAKSHGWLKRMGVAMPGWFYSGLDGPTGNRMNDVAAFLQSEMQELNPTHVLVSIKDKYPEVLDYKFAEEEEKIEQS